MSTRKDAVAGAQDPQIRAQIEARRGIVRDEQGRITRSKEWLQERIARLQEKVADYETRSENAKVEIAERKKELKSLTA